MVDHVNGWPFFLRPRTPWITRWCIKLVRTNATVRTFCNYKKWRETSVSKEQRTKNKEQRKKNKEQRTKNKEQRTKNKEQRTKTKEQRQKNKDKRTKTKEQRLI